MADTQRTIAYLLASLLQDGQAAGSIGEQDLRDLVKSLQFSYASMHVSASAATTVSVAGTFYKVAGTTTLHASNEDFTMPASNRLTYGGVEDRAFIIGAIASLSCGSAAQELGMAVALNGTEIAATKAKGEAVNANKAFALSTFGLSELQNGDYVEAFGTNHTGTNNITADLMQMFAIGIPI